MSKINFPAITNFNFNEFTRFDSTEPKYISEFRHFSIEKVEDNIIFNTNFLACPCIYFVKKDDLFCYSFDYYTVVDFAKENGIELTDTYDNLNTINQHIRKHVKVSIMKRYKHNVNFIEQWKKVVLNRDGSFEKDEYQLDVFSIHIGSCIPHLKKFLNKYKKVVDAAIDDGVFLPTLTGGLDTRAFTGFYRDRVDELDGYFLNAVKQDGKNHVEAGQLELKLAENVAKKIGLKLDRLNVLEEGKKPYITMTGMFNENADSYKDPNDLQYITKIVQHGWDNTHQYLNKITPYMDDDYLLIRQDGEKFRILMIMLLAKDLVFLPFMSGTALFNAYPNGCYIYPLMVPQLTKAITVIENSVGNLDTLNYSSLFEESNHE